MGQPTVPNSITNGAVYTLPSPGKYANVYLIGTATTTGQTKQPFILTYSTGSPVTETLDMSSWAKSAGYADETIVAATAYANNQAGGQVAAPAGGAFNLYGYQLTADPTRTLVSVSVPNNRNVVIMALGFGSNTQVVVPGTYVYNPAAGSTPPLTVGTHTLNVTFTPDNTGGYNGATGSTTIQVIPATPIINWPTPAAISDHAVDQYSARCHRNVPGLDSSWNTLLHDSTRHHGRSQSDPHCRRAYIKGGLYPHRHDGFQLRLGYGTDRGRHHRLNGISGSPLFSSGDCCFFSQPTPYAITVTGSTVAPTGTVTVVFNSQTIGTATLVPGSGATSSASLFVNSIYFAPGNNTVTLNYLGDTNYIPLSNTAVIPLRNPAISANPAVAPGGSSTIQIPYAYVVDGTMSFNFTPAGRTPRPTLPISVARRSLHANLVRRKSQAPFAP